MIGFKLTNSKQILRFTGQVHFRRVASLLSLLRGGGICFNVGFLKRSQEGFPFISSFMHSLSGLRTKSCGSLSDSKPNQLRSDWLTAQSKDSKL